jgi:small subunit ribosomal protein S6
MNRYEIVIVAVSDLSKDDVDGLIGRCSAIIANMKGIVVKVEKWGTRKLAYRIKKQPRGTYVLIDFAGESAVVNELERNLKFDDEVLRFQTIKKEDAVTLEEIEKEIAGSKKEEKPPEVKPLTAAPAKDAEETTQTAVQGDAGSGGAAASEEKGEE